MNPKNLIWQMWVAAFAMAVPVHLTGQQIRYTLVDIPTLGGPTAYGNIDNPEYAQFLNNSGVVVGGADTSVHDPNVPCANQDCFISHGFRWQDGVLTDLGALPGVNFSHATSINARGWATGGSFTAEFDPFKGQSAEHAVLWEGNKIVDLGTLGTGLESAGQYVNNAGEVIGFSTINTEPDSFSFLAAPTHAFVWKNGVMQDLGTLGGPDSFPSGPCNNDRSDLVAGLSLTDSTVNTTTGGPTQHAFVWDHGTMTDIPTLGGTFAFTQCANNGGQVIGFSNLTGDVGCGTPSNCTVHSFLWDHGTLHDLGTLGGTSSAPLWLNNNGDAVGSALTMGDEEVHATLWKNGRITDLNGDGDCFSFARAVNSKHQVIGNTFNCDTGYFTTVLWENGSIIDLNAAIPANSSLFLFEPDNINDRGEIEGLGLPPGCDDVGMCGHVFLLIPCGATHAHACQGNSATTARPTARTAKLHHSGREFVNLWRASLSQPNHKRALATFLNDVVK